MLEAGAMPLHQRPGIVQFVKFCVVGASSFLIDVGVSYFLHYHLGLALILAKTISFTLAVTNGFVWNSRWTFETTEARKHHERYAMFFAVNVVGWALNVGIVTLICGLETGTWLNQHPTKPVFLLATLAATAV